MQPHLGWIETAGVATELDELDPGLALLDVAVEPVATDVVGGDEVADAVGALVGRADPLRLRAGRPAFPAGLGLEVQRPELVQADHDCLPGFREGVELDDPVTLSLEVGVVRAFPAPHGLKADALLAQQLPQPFVGDVRDHPLSDQVVRQLRQAPSRERLIEIAGVSQRDPLDLLALGQRERVRPPTPVARIERVEPVPVEVVDHLAHRVRVGEHDLADLRRRHRLRREQHDLRPPPRHDRARTATNDPQQPVPLVASDLTQHHPGRHCPSRIDNTDTSRLRSPHPQPLLCKPGKHCRTLH